MSFEEAFETLILKGKKVSMHGPTLGYSLSYLYTNILSLWDRKIRLFNFQSCSFSYNHMMAAFPVHNADQWELGFIWSNKILKHVSCFWHRSKVITLNNDAVKWTQPESVWSSRTRGGLISLFYQCVTMCGYFVEKFSVNTLLTYSTWGIWREPQPGIHK